MSAIGEAWQAYRGGLRPSGAVRRRRGDFSVSPELEAYLAQIACSEEVASRVATRMRSMPNPMPYFLIVSGTPQIVVYLAIAFIGVGLGLLVDDAFHQLLIQLSFIVLALIVGFILFVPSIRLYWGWADQRITLELIKVIEASEALAQDVSKAEVRRHLAHTIAEAGSRFAASYPVPVSKVGRRYRREQRQHARAGAAALTSYTTVAMSGDPTNLAALREDFARAVLRVGTGHWIQVADLADETGQGQRVGWRLSITNIGIDFGRVITAFLLAAIPLIGGLIAKAVSG